MKIILGSQSRYRKEILKSMGVEFETMSPDIDERAIRFDDPEVLALALAKAKADALAPRIMGSAILITSDQVVSWNGTIREKPRNVEEARSFLQSYHLAPVRTITAVVATNTAGRKQSQGVDIAQIIFRQIPEEAINEFIANGDPFSKAGGFAVQDPILKPFIEKIDGTEDSIMGLPKTLTTKLMEEVSANL